ncbi:MAG: class I SAM-dependent methyltransferase [Saprospiraceae bacterium]|nr:class I SAM-dependent methyltransferase [Saprospiraceae bacterium]
MSKHDERAILRYCETHTTPVSEALAALDRETHLQTLSPQMLSGPLQGRLLQMLCEMIRPVQVLEIGTFTGYSAICLAQGMGDGGMLHTIEVNPELEHIITRYIALAGMQERIRLHIGDAYEILPTLPGPFDLVWIDAGKQDYNYYYDLVFDKVSPGGYILADNVLWSGKVVANDRDADTLALHRFNQKVQADPRVENILLPIRDGILIARKLPQP